MNPTTRSLLMASAGAGGAGIPIGDFYEGGYFAGYISQNANSVATHGLIVAPAASGYNNKVGLKWKTTVSGTSGTTSTFDGATNTANMANTSHEAANYCAGLTIGGYSDWYLPARYELEIAYFNLKPTTTANTTRFGQNPYSAPQRNSSYTFGDPAQTTVTAFQSGGAEAFVSTGWHWTSTEFSSDPTLAWSIPFSNGEQTLANNKNTLHYVRAFRKFAV